jgi:hypothetical protein
MTAVRASLRFLRNPGAVPVHTEARYEQHEEYKGQEKDEGEGHNTRIW